MTARRAALVWFRRDLRDFRPRRIARGSARRLARPSACSCSTARSSTRSRIGGSSSSARVCASSTTACARGGALIVAARRCARNAPSAAPRSASTSSMSTATSPPRWRATTTWPHPLEERGIDFVAHKDQVIFERDEVRARPAPFTVFTPYRNAWHARLAPLAAHVCDSTPAPRPPRAGLRCAGAPAQQPRLSPTTLRRANRGVAAAHGSSRPSSPDRRLRDGTRNICPADDATRLSVHLRFGTVSVRALARLAHDQRSAATPRSVAVRARLARFLRAAAVAPPARRRARLPDPARRPAVFVTWP